MRHLLLDTRVLLSVRPACDIRQWRQTCQYNTVLAVPMFQFEIWFVVVNLSQARTW